MPTSSAIRLTTQDWPRNLARLSGRYALAAGAGGLSVILIASVDALVRAIAGSFAHLSEGERLMLPWTALVSLIVVGLTAWNLYRSLGVDRIEALNEKRRASSRLVSRGEFVDGTRHLEVALAVTPSTFFYENADMECSIDLGWVREIEYDTELATGTVPHAGKVLRLRSGNHTFEFVIPNDVVALWHLTLPPRREQEGAAADQTA